MNELIREAVVSAIGNEEIAKSIMVLFYMEPGTVTSSELDMKEYFAACLANKEMAEYMIDVMLGNASWTPSTPEMEEVCTAAFANPEAAQLLILGYND